MSGSITLRSGMLAPTPTLTMVVKNRYRPVGMAAFEVTLETSTDVAALKRNDIGSLAEFDLFQIGDR